MRQYNKLVRDKIPEIISAKGKKVIAHIAGDNEYWEKLIEKILEEVKEFVKEPIEEELADIMEVLEAIAEHKNLDKKEVEEIKMRKAKERGTFKKKIILEES